MFDHIRRDTQRLKLTKTKSFPWYVLESLLFENGYQAVVFYRIARWFKSRKIPFMGPLFARLGLWLTGVDISPGASIGPGLVIAHGVGLVVGGYVTIGDDAILLHQVTLGSPHHHYTDRMPQLGHGVFVGAGAKIIGDIQVGDGALIGSGVILTESVPARAKVLLKQEITVVTAQEEPDTETIPEPRNLS